MMLPHGVRKQHPPGGGGIFFTSRLFMVMIASAIPSFFLGTTVTLYSGLTKQSSSCVHNNAPSRSSDTIINDRVQQLLKEKEQELLKSQSAQLERMIEKRLQEHGCAGAQSVDAVPYLFDNSKVGNFLAGAALTPKSNLTDMLDLGVPLDTLKEGSDHVLLLYSRTRSLPEALMPPDNELPKNKKQVPPPSQQIKQRTIPVLSMADAVKNCDSVHVILTDHSRLRDQCIAIVPQYESYHLQNWMRMPEITGKGVVANKTNPLRLVSRGQKLNGRSEFPPPTMVDTNKLWNMLAKYFEALPEVTEELKVILNKVAVDNTVIVMVCNFGQSELLMNFVCSAKTRGLDMSSIIIFATDQDTADLAEGLGLTAYYDKRNFGDIPEKAAKRYGDARFTAMMMAKVICVQMVSMLGFNFLFQDVDIVWFKNPLDYFNDKNNPAYQYDAFFQDDGGHSIRYSPYSANSGFYFIRYNDRTRHFLTSILMAGDLVIKTDSHQQALIAVLNEHVSLYGLKVKVLSRDMEEFPGGYQWNQKTGNYMRAFYSGEMNPIIFHMSWTLNKDNKLLYFRQMGEWYVKDQCIEKKKSEITGAESGIVPACCSTEALFSCHYRDKPSKQPCKDSPPIDAGKPSWWK